MHSCDLANVSVCTTALAETCHSRIGNGSLALVSKSPFGIGAGYPGRGGGLWLRMILPAGLVTRLVPSG